MNFFWFSTIALINSIWLIRNVGYPTWKWITSSTHRNEWKALRSERNFYYAFTVCVYVASVDEEVYALRENFSWKAFYQWRQSELLILFNNYYYGAIFCIFFHSYFKRWLHLYLIDDFSFHPIILLIQNFIGIFSHIMELSLMLFYTARRHNY